MLSKIGGMGRGNPYPIELTDGERGELVLRAGQYTRPHREVVRAKIVLLAAEGLPNTEIARRLNVSDSNVGMWRRRFFEHRIDGLEDLPRSGRPPAFSP